MIEYDKNCNKCHGTGCTCGNHEIECHSLKLCTGCTCGKEIQFSDDDLWDFDCTIAKFVLPRLKRFKTITESFPGNGISEKEWNIILDRIIFSFEHIVNTEWEIDDNIHKVKKYKIYKQIQSGLDLFGKYFRDLWS